MTNYLERFLLAWLALAVVIRFLLAWLALAVVTLPILLVYHVVIGGADLKFVIFGWAVAFAWGFLVGPAYLLCREWVRGQRSR